MQPLTDSRNNTGESDPQQTGSITYQPHPFQERNEEMGRNERGKGKGMSVVLTLCHCRVIALDGHRHRAIVYTTLAMSRGKNHINLSMT